MTATYYSVALESMSDTWEFMTRNIESLESWKYVFYVTEIRLAGILCLGIVDHEGDHCSVPYPLHWEFM